jgi:hypothetical protein
VEPKAAVLVVVGQVAAARGLTVVVQLRLVQLTEVAAAVLVALAEAGVTAVQAVLVLLLFLF